MSVIERTVMHYKEIGRAYYKIDTSPKEGGIN